MIVMQAPIFFEGANEMKKEMLFIMFVLDDKNYSSR